MTKKSPLRVELIDQKRYVDLVSVTISFHCDVKVQIRGSAKFLGIKECSIWRALNQGSVCSVFIFFKFGGCSFSASYW